MQKLEGLILKSLSGFYYIEAAGAIYECKARGIFRKANHAPLVGDCVTIQVMENAENTIEAIGERRNYLIRPPLANLDQLVVVASMTGPSLNLQLVDKLTAIASSKDIEAVIAINKADLLDAGPVVSDYQKAGFKAVALSTITGEGIAVLRGWLKGRVSAFTGNSGVGKSSLLNSIDERLGLSTGEISQKLGRGRHTTRHVELFPFEGGYIADTPGFSSLDLERYEIIRKEDLQFCFPEFAPFLGKCRFSTCAHVSDQGCAIVEALEAGTIVPSRHQSYVQLYHQVKDIKEWEHK